MKKVGNTKKLNIILSMLCCALAIVSLFAIGGILLKVRGGKDNEDGGGVRYNKEGLYYASKAETTNTEAFSGEYKGGSIYLDGISTDGAELTMNGGEISNHSSRYGGAIYVANGATFTMNAGTISNCSAIYGGAIYVERGGTCIINGGTITGCKAQNAPSIYAEYGAIIEIGENAKIESNIVTKFVTVTFDADGIESTENEVMVMGIDAVSNTSLYPLIPDDVTGFAGEWVLQTTSSFTANASSTASEYRFVVNYGDGTENDPYLVKNFAQFKAIIDEFAQQTITTYYDSSNAIVTEETSAVKMIKTYKTVQEVYTRATISATWTRSSYDASNKKYFRLIQDIDMSAGLFNIGASASVSIDGTAHNYRGVATEENYSLVKFSNNNLADGFLFDVVYDFELKNVDIELYNKLPTMVYCARGDISFKNIDVNSYDGADIFIDSDQTNVSPFVSFVLNSATCTFNNIETNVNYLSHSQYFGLLVGGYATSTTTVNFVNCINYGDNITIGAMGMLFGNSSQRPASMVVSGCANHGTFKYKGAGNQQTHSHILAPYFNDYNKPYTHNELRVYDSTVVGEFSQQGTISLLPSVVTISYTDADVIISSTSGEALTPGNYEIHIWTYLWAELTADGAGTGSSLRTLIKFNYVVEEGNTKSSITIPNIQYIILDKYQFEFYGGEYIEEEWNDKDCTFKYRKGTLDGVIYYVVDSGEMYQQIGLKPRRPLLIATNANGEVIDFASAS